MKLDYSIHIAKETLKHKLYMLCMVAFLCFTTTYSSTLDSPMVAENISSDHPAPMSKIEHSSASKQVGEKLSIKRKFQKIYGGMTTSAMLCYLLGGVVWCLVSFALYKLWDKLLRKYARSLTTKEYEGIDSLFFPFNLLLIGLLTKASTLIFFHAGSGFLIILRSGLLFLTMIVCNKLVDFLTFYLREQTVEKKKRVDLTLLPMMKIVLKIIITIVGVIVVLQSLGFNIKTLLAGLGIGGLGFALASQDTIKNLFGSLVILTDKPFVLGDYIVSENIAGTVEEIGFRSTRVKTDQNSMIYIPNGRLADMCVDNQGPKEYKQFSVKLAIPQSTMPSRIASFLEKLKDMVTQMPDVRADQQYIYLHQLKESAFYIKFDVLLHASDGRSELASRQAILLKISQLSHELGISLGPCTFPYPLEYPSA